MEGGTQEEEEVPPPAVESARRPRRRMCPQLLGSPTVPARTPDPKPPPHMHQPQQLPEVGDRRG